MLRKLTVLLVPVALAALALLLARFAMRPAGRRPEACGAPSSIAHPSVRATVGPAPVAGDPPKAAVPSTPDSGADCCLEGRVLAADGTPCAADVFAWPDGGATEDERPHTARSDADGRYNLVLPPDDWKVCAVSAADISEDLRAQLHAGEHRTEDLRLRPGAVVSGSVTDPQGSPVAGASVVCRDDDGVHVLGQVTAEDTGRYRMTVPPADLLLVARVEGYAPAMERASVQAGQEAYVDLRLTRGLSIAGRVVDSAGLPIPGARVSATLDEDTSTSELLGKAEAPVDRDGRYELGPLRDAEYDVTPAGDGYAWEAPRRVRAGQREVDFVLLRNGTLDGVVVRASDGSSVDVSPECILVSPVGSHLGLRVAGAHGVFHGDFHPGKYRVLVDGGRLAYGEREVEVLEGKTMSVRVELTEGGTLRGVVVAARGGVPVAHAEVSITRLIGCVVTRTDEHGRVTWSGMDPGVRVLDVEAPGFAALHESIEIAEGKTVDRTFTLRDEARIVGKLLREDGCPVGDAWIHVVGPQGSLGGQEATDGGGYSIGGLGAGQCLLCSADYHPGRVVLAIAHVDLREGEEQRVDLAPAHAGRIVGTVRVGSRVGRRIEVRLTSPEWEGFKGFLVETDASGRFEFVGAPPGRYALTVETTRRDADLVAGGGDVTVEFDLPAGPAK